jgi:hypothetical protein
MRSVHREKAGEEQELILRWHHQPPAVGLSILAAGVSPEKQSLLCFV